MNSSTINHLYHINQDAKEGIVTKKGFALTRLLHQLIREYGQYDDGSYSVDVDNFTLSDKRLVLSHIESAEWYEYACESIAKTEALFSECSKSMQKLIDDCCHEVYCEDMEEMRNYR